MRAGRRTDARRSGRPSFFHGRRGACFFLQRRLCFCLQILGLIIIGDTGAPFVFTFLFRDFHMVFLLLLPKLLRSVPSVQKRNIVTSMSTTRKTLILFGDFLFYYYLCPQKKRMKYRIEKETKPSLPTFGKYKAVAVHQQTISSSQIITEASQDHPYSKGEITGVLIRLSEVINRHLRNGDRVRLADWGMMKLEIESDKVDSPNDLRPRDHIRGVRKYNHELLNGLFYHPHTKIDHVVANMQVSRQTVSKYLDRIMALGLLQKEKMGKENYYINTRLMSLFIEFGKYEVTEPAETIGSVHVNEFVKC